MEYNQIPKTGTIGGMIDNITANFQLTKEMLERLEVTKDHAVGLFSTLASLQTAYPTPEVGDWALVGDTTPFAIYKCSTAGSWSDTGGTYDGGTIDLSGYVKKEELDELTLGAVYDVSAKNPTAGHNNDGKFESLSALLSDANLNTLIPTAVRKGGMSIKFVLSSDNKYVQYRYMETVTTAATFTNVVNWQGVDDEPTDGSENLVKSGGVAAAIKDTLPQDILEDGLYICNKNGKAIVRLDVLDTKGGFGENLVTVINALINNITSSIESDVDSLEDEVVNSTKSKDTVEEGLYICDERGNAVIRLDILDNTGGFGDNLKKKIQEEAGINDVFEDGFYITDENGGVIAKYEGGKWVLFETKYAGFYRKTGNLASGDTWVLSNNSVKNDKRLVFSGTISSFSSVTIGHGVANQWNASWLVVDATNITVYNWNGSQSSSEYAHGLTILHNIQVEIVKNTGSKATIKIASDGEVFSQEVTWAGDNGNIYVSSTSVLTNCSFSWTCDKLFNGIWMFGDSFLSVSEASRWPYYLIQDGFLNWMQNGHSGGGVDDNVPALKNLLKIAKPRTILWLCNGNHPDPFEGETPDPATDITVNQKWLGAFKEVEYICKQNNIELVLCTFPTSYASEPVAGHSGEFDWQEPKNKFVRESGYRYIDFNAAVGGDGSGNWWEGMKNPNDVHPTVKGAKSLYQRAITDAPELMQ